MPTLYKTLAPKSFFDSEESAGMTQIVVIRQRKEDHFEMGFFLVDSLCLGIKDAFFISGDREFYDELVERTFPDGSFVEKSGAWGRKFIESAEAYARQFGFAPHSDYKKARKVLGGINAKDCDESFAFGKDGKPFYMQGPHDSHEKAQKIIARLQSRCGEGNYNYLVKLDDHEEDDYEEDDEEEYEDEEEYDLEEFLYAEQTGGGEPSKRFAELAIDYSEYKYNKPSPKYTYTGDSEIAERVEELLEIMYEQLIQSEELFKWDEKSLFKDKEQFARFVTVLILNELFLLYPLDEEQRNEELSASDFIEGKRGFMLNALKDKEMLGALKSITECYEGETNHILDIQWSTENLTLEGKPRVEVFCFRVFNS